MNNPLVSISCITYNHASYIRECLEGFLMQKCNFDFEVLIHDDASTDGTQEIIKEYQEKYPEIIKPILQKENQWSQGVRGINFNFNFPRARGKYLALCEGDDYWTDPLKLQKQVDFLEENPDYTLAVGGFKSINRNTGGEEVELLNVDGSSDLGFDVTLPMLFHGWYTKTLTLIFRKNVLDIELVKKYKYARDFHLNYHLLKIGKGFYFKTIFGVYNIHEGGIFSTTDQSNRNKNNLIIFKELYEKNINDEYVRKIYLNTVRQKILYSKKNVNLKLIKELISLTKSLKDLEINLKTIFYALLKKNNE